MKNQLPRVYRYKPMIDSRAADKFMLRMPDKMRDDVKERAGENNRSMNSELLDMIERQLNASSESAKWIPTVGQVVRYEEKYYVIDNFVFERGGLYAKLKPTFLQSGSFGLPPEDPTVLVFELTPLQL